MNDYFKACANDVRAKDWQAVKQGQRRELSQDCQPKRIRDLFLLH
ncbi:hypothetical protein AAULR_01655 [Lacticaseibacillus rhamnosus MTCC 5462]|nr:hypothetical protein AAULR_01655 [Lacticaseibacillus rhamnosus MTCC 5462]